MMKSIASFQMSLQLKDWLNKEVKLSDKYYQTGKEEDDNQLQERFVR